MLSLFTHIILPQFSWFIFLGGSGVPPGTKPETCRRCKGSGMVSDFKYLLS